MSVESTAGTVLSVSIGQPAAQTQAAYEALTWTPVGEVIDLGEVGAEGNLISYQSIGSRLDQKLKGSINAGSQALQLGKDLADAGQSILSDASKIGDATVDVNLSFRIAYKDGTSFDYYQGLVMSYKTTFSGSNNVLGASCNVELNTSVVEV